MRLPASSVAGTSNTGRCPSGWNSKARCVRVQSSSNGKHARQTTIHRLIDEQGILLVPGCYDALSAMLVAQAGHKAGFISGYAVSASLLGEPDVGLLTPPEMAAKAGQITYAVPNLPIIADADTGGGAALNVQRTIKQLIAAGCKGCMLEDQRWPKKSGHMRSKEVIAMDDFAAKVYAARAAIGDADFFLIARTDVRGTSAKYGLGEALTRANLYMDAGADGTLIEAPRSNYEMARIGEKTRGIRVCNIIEGGVTPLHSRDELRAMGFHMVMYPLTSLYAVTKALKNVYTSLNAEGSSLSSLNQLIAFDEFNELVGYDEKVRLEEKYYTSDGEKLHVRIRALTRPYQPQEW